MLPGLINDARLWQRQANTLADIATTRIADISRHDNIAALAADVLTQAPERFALAGLSMGGYIALEIMRAAPERVLGLALCDTNARPDTAESTARRRQQIAQARIDFPQVVESLTPSMFAPSHRGDTALAMLFADMAAQVGVEAFIRQQTAIMHRVDSRPGLARITCPTLVLCGGDDQLTPFALHKEMADAIADADLIIVNEAGHLSPLEQPDAVSAALRHWLERL
ncbi:MAG: alpha/beta fold hydrolase [Rhodocyclaceae bacterium]